MSGRGRCRGSSRRGPARSLHARLAPVVGQLAARQITLSAMSEFIFMLTRNDTTLADARAIYASIADTGLRHVGCKDVGLPQAELAQFMDEIRANGHPWSRGVVAEPEKQPRQSPGGGAEMGPDTLTGGPVMEPIQEIL